MKDKTGSRAIDAEHIKHQRLWSLGTFGPSTRTRGVVEHMRRELDEVEQDPYDVFEWADLIILAIDGAWRHGHEPQQIIDAVLEKQARNEVRTWPDWRNRSEDEPIEHDRSREKATRAARAHPSSDREEAMKPQTFRKRPVVIEAMRVGKPYRAVELWSGATSVCESSGRVAYMLVETLEGTMRADLGDWIIRGVQGEFYPCKPDIFEATYEPAR